MGPGMIPRRLGKGRNRGQSTLSLASPRAVFLQTAPRSPGKLAEPRRARRKMPRRPRIDLPHVTQHVVQRGNDRQPCFFTTGDYERGETGVRVLFQKSVL